MPFHIRTRERIEDKPVEGLRLSEDDPPFTLVELKAVLRELNPKKAPGPDGLTADICIAAIESEMEVFLAIANKCLELAYFPTHWKTAHVVIIPKPGKEDYTLPKSYRPIGLLPIPGKIVEKLMIGRIQWHMLPSLSPKQYGFMPQRSTEDALYDLVNHVKKEIESKKAVLLISLDIEGAFDNAWWPALKTQLIDKKCPGNLYQMACSYLTERKITVNYARETVTKSTNKGCVQGSICGPTFWNIIIDSLLQRLTDAKVHCQAFADDVVLASRVNRAPP
ncbi:Putative 115 kDa protein in type-1 retrotransposable element R1DM [Eumeta japonica]|uniref:115 kDa protein in type-1 retrotransposable element R1DM n=1 Tax=Eumeta variegata TaxID=151549 RepID=A0A4C1SFC9_EUMVA|nr:Putative 115 kDa protein in type-1 retrotransposable element R1DM [Eumeta japonica]